MTPVYFPFTWIDAATLEAVTAVFPRMAVYHPVIGRVSTALQGFIDSGALEIRAPIPSDSGKVERLAADYQNWARLHQGNDLAFLKSRQPAVPFTDHLASQIRSDILHYSERPPKAADDPVFNARLFLEIAAAYDAQQAELNSDLASIDHLEKRFMAALGDAAETETPIPLGNLPLFPEDAADFMLAERIHAWSLLVLQDEAHRLWDGLWVTTCSGVLAWFQEETETIPILDIPCIPIPGTMGDDVRLWQESILAYLSRLQSAPWPSAVQSFEPPSSWNCTRDHGASVKGWIMPNQTPGALLRKMAGKSAAPVPDSERIRHALVLCITPA